MNDDKKIQELFKLELTNKFQVLTDMGRMENETVEEIWRKIRTTFTEASEKVLGFKEKNKRLDDSTDLGKDQRTKKG